MIKQLRKKLNQGRPLMFFVAPFIAVLCSFAGMICYDGASAIIALPTLTTHVAYGVLELTAGGGFLAGLWMDLTGHGI